MLLDTHEAHDHISLKISIVLPKGKEVIIHLQIKVLIQCKLVFAKNYLTHCYQEYYAMCRPKCFLTLRCCDIDVLLTEGNISEQCVNLPPGVSGVRSQSAPF